MFSLYQSPLDFNNLFTIKKRPKKSLFYFFNSTKLKSLPLYEFTNKIYCIGVERVSSQMAGRVCFCSTWQANQNPKAEAV